MVLKRKARGPLLWGADGAYGLTESPWGNTEIFNADNEDAVYVPEAYGAQLEEFHEKFYLGPMSREKNRQVVGGLWSKDDGNGEGKGYGKSLLMYNESREINRDFGAAKLRAAGCDDEDIENNPFVSAYCGFEQSKEITAFSAAILDGVAFILESPHDEMGNVHLALRERIAEAVGADDGYVSESLADALRKRLRRFRSLNMQLTHASVTKFIQKLCADDTEEVVRFIRQELGPRVKVRQGFNIVHIFNAFLQLAGVNYVTYCVDQVENFGRFSRNQDRDLKMLRESMCQTAPTSAMASFIFQMHVHALEAIEGWWDRVEHLPSLDPSVRANRPRLVNLQGLTRRKEAECLAAAGLKSRRPAGYKPPSDLHPFDRDIIESVRQHVHGNPRDFCRTLDNILKRGEDDRQERFDLDYVTDILEEQEEDLSLVDADDDLVNPER